jgi:hypothetical protein
MKTVLNSVANRGVDMGVANYIENRWSQRRSLDMDVEILLHGSVIGHTRTRDVGLGGVFLFLDKGEHLSPEEDVDLMFMSGEQSGSRARHKLRARVVRHTAEGVGLMFRDFDTSAFRALQEVMKHAAKPV